MRRFIAIVLIFSLGVAIVGTYISRPPDTVTAGNCSAQDLLSVQQSIANQTRSLGAQDFGQAMSYSSDSFRSSISESQFARIISVGYEFLLQNPEISFDSCDQNTDGQIVISAFFDTGSDVTRLTYFMINEKDGWFIDSASRPGNDQLTV